MASNLCAECGCPLNEGEAKTFTVCDDCWDKTYVQVEKDMWELGRFEELAHMGWRGLQNIASMLGKECEEKTALGVATSAVRQLMKEHDALREAFRNDRRY